MRAQPRHALASCTDVRFVAVDTDSRSVSQIKGWFARPEPSCRNHGSVTSVFTKLQVFAPRAAARSLVPVHARLDATMLDDGAGLTLLLSLRFMSLVFEEARNIAMGLAARNVDWKAQVLASAGSGPCNMASPAQCQTLHGSMR